MTKGQHQPKSNYLVGENSPPCFRLTFPALQEPSENWGERVETYRSDDVGGALFYRVAWAEILKLATPRDISLLVIKEASSRARNNIQILDPLDHIACLINYMLTSCFSSNKVPTMLGSLPTGSKQGNVQTLDSLRWMSATLVPTPERREKYAVSTETAFPTLSTFVNTEKSVKGSDADFTKRNPRWRFMFGYILQEGFITT
ncbi:PREDICTED: LOW QUALITY PROTEIN: putative uncharacterized protein C12orf77 homolog [Cercocebus atys]|uniref:LOW QUALITY PROTEIN: putative uncharacterized protein C12orf77 homolog n=1 Tax=Cercocebus atys TaxID=9531 RepID=UPI0005F478F0|nr:PREDICTED: LOW QUALITY PROTEIN: putative uncharacterized protein C12orf77 homolog [Cercocebus atys]